MDNAELHTFKISRVVEENAEGVKTFFVKNPRIAESVKPGQFVLVWTPGGEEIPLSVSLVDGEEIGFTVKQFGEGSKALLARKEGDFVGVRGPFGNGFDLNHERVLIIGGGVGIANLSLIPNYHDFFDVILSVSSKSGLILERAFSSAKRKWVAASDGSGNFSGRGTVLLDQLLEKEKYDCVLSCGPEKMLESVLNVCEKHSLKCQLSLERIMKCGIGVCGHCAMDPDGWLVCKDGPVAYGDKIRSFTEFSRYSRNQSGKEVPL
jgi:dihydroorotate dehydrogenase electron transfer subunit